MEVEEEGEGVAWSTCVLLLVVSHWLTYCRLLSLVVITVVVVIVLKSEREKAKITIVLEWLMLKWEMERKVRD